MTARAAGRPPIVSVVTATRNRPHLLRQALLSIKQQSFEDFEAIVIDDGSRAEVHGEYGALWNDLDDRFRLHLASPPDGPGSDPGRGRNVGIGLATGTFVAFLDHDDVWERADHLAVAVDALQAAGADYLFSHVRLEPPHPSLVGFARPHEFADCPAIPGFATVHHVPLPAFLRVMRHRHIHPSHSIVRRETANQVGRFIEGLRTFDDVNFMFRVADVCRGILYRSDAAVAIRLPEAGSFSLSSSRTEQVLAEHQAMLDIRARCRTPAVRRCARSRQAWALRQLADNVSATSEREAFLLRWQALVTFPTAGAAWSTVRSAIRAL